MLICSILCTGICSIVIAFTEKVLHDLPVSPKSVLSPANKREVNAAKALPKPPLGPKESQSPKPVPAKPWLLEPTVAKTMKPTPPPTPELTPLKQPAFPKLKPIVQVKPLPSGSRKK